ncbi:MAG: 3-oxoadipate enol-lactonase, partial [Candidatus Rokuibacteriota bacterium]
HEPERIERLVLACATGRFLTREAWQERAATVRAEGTEALADGVMERWFSAAFRSRDPATVARCRAMLAGTPAEGYAGCCEALAAFDLRPRLGSITAPTLVVTGELDPVVPPASGETLAESIHGARHVSLPGAAHIANIEQPAQFTDAVLDHLTRDTEAA